MVDSSFQKYAALCGTVCLMLLFAFTPGISFNEDLGRHLLMGRIILHTAHVPDTNLLTYTAPEFPFVNHHWLSQVVLFLIYKVVGLNGLIIWKTGMMGLTVWLCMHTFSPRRGQSLYYLLGILGVIIMGYRVDMRPELFTYFFMGIYFFLFEKSRRGGRKSRWLIVPIACLWANIHIYFIFGLGMAGAFALERWGRDRSRRSFVRETGWFLTIVMASIINPNTYKGLLYPFTIFSNYSVAIIENQSPLELWKTALNPMLLALPVLSAMVIVALLINLAAVRKKKNNSCDGVGEMDKSPLPIAYMIIATAALIAAWFMVRSAPLLALSAFPLLGTTLDRFHFDIVTPRGVFLKRVQWVPFGIILLLNCIIAFTVMDGKYSRMFPAPIRPTPLGFDQEARYFRLTELARDFGLRGPLFTDYGIGGLAEFELYPEPGYADNRPEAFPSNFWYGEYGPALLLWPEWERISAARGFNAVIVSIQIGGNFISRLYRSPEWVLVSLDEICAVFVKNVPGNRNIIEQLGFRPSRLNDYERDIAERVDKLPRLPWWRRQVEAYTLTMRLYALGCIGEKNRVWPYAWRLHLLYPDYLDIDEMLLMTVPRGEIPRVKEIISAIARWPLAARHVSYWGKILIRQGKEKDALAVFRRGRLFFPFSPVLRQEIIGLARQIDEGIFSYDRSSPSAGGGD